MNSVGRSRVWVLWIMLAAATTGWQVSAIAASAQQDAGCRLRYTGGQELMIVRDPRIEAIFSRLLEQAAIKEAVLLCGTILPDELRFAETVRRSDGRAVIAISEAVVAFDEEQLSGVLAHELWHLLLGAPGWRQPASLSEFLAEERQADLEAARLVGPAAVCAAVRRVYEASVRPGAREENKVLRRYRDQRLDWISKSDRGTSPACHR
jgi:Zn-dependent protease with chaperone function